MLDPAILFFILGLTAGLAKSDLRLPSAIYDALSVFLLLAIGLKGGAELAQHALLPLLPQILLVLAMGSLVPFAVYGLARALGFPVADSGALAGHYGSVSVVTFAVGATYLTTHNIPFEGQMTLFLALLEMPGLLVGVWLARRTQTGLPLGELLHDVLLGKSMVLIAGGIAIGWISGPEGLKPIQPLYKDLFKGVLTLFLLEMGLITASKLVVLRRWGWKIPLLGIGLPLLLAPIGLLLGLMLGLSTGGMTLMAVLAASASYIAAPAAMRIAVPEANPGISLGAALGCTFPFNLIIGIPLYYQWARLLA